MGRRPDRASTGSGRHGDRHVTQPVIPWSCRSSGEDLSSIGEASMSAQVMKSADVAPSASIGDDTVVWHLAQVRESATIGAGCTVGRGAYVGSGVEVGENVKIQNYALVYEPAVLGAGAFVGPAAVLTNDRFPRSVTPDGERKSAEDWTAEGVRVGQGASIGARAVILGGVTLGDWSMVAAGAIVTKDVAPFALVVGAPARQIGWVGRAGHPLEHVDADRLRCPATGANYRLIGARLEETST
jgi:UDP-2-acetamido-3-amino-2,3-dideoxy-glucuronate N-acetyltransferase